MSVINTASGGGSSVATTFEFDRSPGNALARSLAPMLATGGFRSAPDVRLAPYADAAETGGGAARASFGSLFTAFMSEIASLFAQLARSMQSAGWTSETVPGDARGERAFEHATTGSTGDPHESFAGVGADGRVVSRTWDSMTSHRNLLSSDSFAGGYRVSNTVTQPSANGATLNARVEVTTDGGKTSVGMNADGSYDVAAFGRHVDLAEGRTVRLTGEEAVTLNADRSITIDERNGAGSSIATTLRRNGDGGVDVTNDAHHVDLGGYLVTMEDDEVDPVVLAPAPGPYGGGFNGIEPIAASAVDGAESRRFVDLERDGLPLTLA
ncbi:MAG: hypothetical protein NVS2B3_01320 [Vulcanimicrobiaceae bacterium]